MAGDTSGKRSAASGMSFLEEELTMHLERANELGRRLKRANDAVEEELRRTRRLVDVLRDAAQDPA